MPPPSPGGAATFRIGARPPSPGPARICAGLLRPASSCLHHAHFLPLPPSAPRRGSSSRGRHYELSSEAVARGSSFGGVHPNPSPLGVVRLERTLLLEEEAQARVEEALAAGKIGCGTVSQALAYKLPFVFVRRDYFKEEPFLWNMLQMPLIHFSATDFNGVMSQGSH